MLIVRIKISRLGRENDKLLKQLFALQMQNEQLKQDYGGTAMPNQTSAPSSEAGKLGTRVEQLEAEAEENNRRFDELNDAVTRAQEGWKRSRDGESAKNADNQRLREENDALRKERSLAQRQAEQWLGEVRRLEMLAQFKEQRILQFATTQRERANGASQYSETDRAQPACAFCWLSFSSPSHTHSTQTTVISWRSNRFERLPFLFRPHH
jgi:chromosome segregation ATPase